MKAPQALLRARATPVAVARVVSAGCAALVVFVSSAVLTPAVRGEFAALQTAAILVATAGGLSMALGVSVAVGARSATARHAAAAAVGQALVLGCLLVPLSLALAGCIGLDSSTALALALAATVVAVYAGLQGVPIGLGRTTLYGTTDVIRAVASLAAVAAALAAGMRSPGGLLAVWAAGAVVGSVAVGWVPATTRSEGRFAETARLVLRRGLRAHPTNLAGLAVARLDIVVLAAVSTHPQVAYYSLAVVIAEAAWLMPSALAVTSLSDFVRLPGGEALQAARRALRRTVGVAGVTAVLALAGGVLATLLALPHAYHAAIAPLAIALAGAVPYSVGHVVSPYLVTAIDRPGVATGIAVATLAVDLLLVLLLGGPLGAIGAAIASTAAYGLHAGLNLAALRRAQPA